MAVADISYVASHLGLDRLDQPIIEALSTDGAVFLNAVAAKCHEFDTLIADKLQTDIELENAVRSSENRFQTSKATSEQALKDVEEARQKLKDEETKRQEVENELQILKTKNSDHEAEVKALNDKIETLQSSNRANLSIIESHNKRDQSLAEELAKQHQKNVDLARENTALQQSEQNAKGQLNSAKYREESLQQQLDLSRRNGEWFEAELKTKSDEALKYRKEKGARISELQRENEDLRSQGDSLKRTEQQLRERVQTMQAKVDETLVKLQKQEGSFATTVESYKQELEDQRRLVDMSAQLSQKHQERVRELEGEKERLKDNYENEIRRVRVELEQERQAIADNEAKIQKLESDLDEAHARLDQGPPPASVPQTPRANGSMAGRAASPFGTPGSLRSTSAITATQAIEQLYQVKGQLASEKRRNAQLSEELDNMMTALEAKAPEIQELQSEVENTRYEMARMSELSQQSFEERDISRRAARKAEAALGNTQSENNILRKQLRDLGTQIQMLVFNIYAMEKGVAQLTEEEKYRIKQLEQGEITEDALSDMSDTHQFITQKLLVFKDIASLQTKNEDLMRITRELADQLESDEALAAKDQAKDDHAMVEKLQQELSHMVEETKAVKQTMDSYKMERDMFRRLLQQRGVGGEEASLMRSSLDGSGRLPLASIESSEQVEALNEVVRRLQAEFDGFREVQDGVRKDLREANDRLSAEKNSALTDNVKLQGEVRLVTERMEMLQSNYVALQSENTELQKRAQALSESAAKQDIRTQQIAEELIEARGLLDSMRNETANLKAEKKLWKDIQDRMSKDNETLIEEKNRLNNILATQQSLENERNLSESEARRKTEGRMETLERELNDTQRKLSYESEEMKKLQLRKEFEARESQKRVDELLASLSQIREDHVGVKTTRDHLQARVNELTVELRNAEERVGRLQPRPTPRPGSNVDANQQHQQELETEIADMNNEISDLKRDVDMANTHLENAKTQAEQYKTLSQGNEEALEDLRSSQDQYRQEMEALVEEKDVKIKELGQRVEDMSTELSRSNTELSTLRDTQGEVARKFEDEKVILEEEVNRLKEDSARHVEAARFHQQDLRAQADIATKAQQDYETELVKHAEAAKQVQQLRNDHNQLKSESASLRAEAESARVTLTQSEGSWEDRRQQFEQEISELKTRREDVNAQNKLLHQQLEHLTGQVTALQQRRAGDENDEPIATGQGPAIEGLNELNSYLRREKEILEVQYDMKTQESKRLQQQLEYTQSQLDEARLKLDQERTQTAQGGRNSMTHQDLMEKLNELNLYRESSTALRNENNQLKDQISGKNKRVEEMENKVQPLEAEIDGLKTQKSFLEDEIKQIQEDRDRWQKRTEGILTKYGRVDPAEMDSLKKSAKNLETERDALKAAQEPLNTKISELESTLETERSTWQTSRSKIVEQAKERSRKLTGEKNEAIQRANGLQEQLEKVNVDLESTKASADQAGQEKSELEKQIEGFQQQVEQLRQQVQKPVSAETPAAAPVPAALDASASAEVVAQLEQHLADARKELEAVNAQKLGAETQLEAVRAELQSAVADRDTAVQKLQTAEATQTTAAQQPDATESTEAPIQNGTPAISSEEKKALEDKLAGAEAKVAEAEGKANEIESRIAQTIKERSDTMKEKLNNMLKTNRAKLEQDFAKKNEDLKLHFEQEKKIWQAENASAKPPGTPAMEQPPATPAKVEAQATPSTPSAGALDLAQLDDGDVRQFLATNPTVKSIVAANIKKRLEAETSKSKVEWEAKVTAAREQAQLMESKKSTLRINMMENKLKGSTAKLGVVETAASETPQKPVVEVWEIVKTTQAPPATPAPKPAPAATPARTMQRQPSVGGAPSPVQTTTPSGGLFAGQNTSTPAAQSAPPTNNATPVPNPFAVPADANAAEAPNPFAPKPEAAAEATPTAQKQPPGQAQAQQPVRSGIPMPRGGGGGRGRGGLPVPQGQRAPSGAHEGAPGARGGRGGARGGRGAHLNASAAEYQPGNKRPRGDSETGGGAKRARGGH